MKHSSHDIGRSRGGQSRGGQSRGGQSRGPSRVCSRRALLERGLALPLALAATGCGGILPGRGPPVDLYRLTPKSSFEAGKPKAEWQLVLEAPTSAASLNTTRIALQRDPMKIEYYARAGWIDRAPAMLQTLMLESFENSGRIISVGRENIGLRSDFVLKTDLREFQALYYDGTPPSVLVAFNLKLVQMPRREIVGSILLSHKAQAQSDRVADVVEAYDLALGKVLKRTVGWTLATGAQFWTGA